MSASVTRRAAPGRGLSWRWPFAIALVLALHGAALFLLERTRIVEDPVAPVEAILLDLAPAPAASPPTPEVQPPTAPPVPAEPPPTSAVQPLADVPPDPPVKTEALPVEPPTPLPPPPRIVPLKPEVVLPRPRPPRPVARPRPRTMAAPTPIQTEAPPAPMTTEPARPAPPREPAPRPTAAASSPPSAAAAANWAGLLAAHLRRFRHYPPDAERRGMTGVVLMRFSLDAGGHIVSSSMARSSGHDVLDEEAEAWLRRAQPLPPPPSDKVAPAQLVMPLEFTLQ